jgi:hypothetical protein
LVFSRSGLSKSGVISLMIAKLGDTICHIAQQSEPEFSDRV